MIFNSLFRIIILTFLFVNILNSQTSKWRIVWEPNPASDSVAYYEIYIGINSDTSNATLVGTVNYPNSEYIDSLGRGGQGLQKGQLYYYWVKAANQYGRNKFSEPDSASIPEILFNDSLKFIKDTIVTFPKSQVVDDPDHDMFPDSLDWSMNGISTMNYQAGELSVEILPLYNTIFATTQNWQGPELVLFKVTDPDSFFDIKSVNILLKPTIVSGDTLDDSIINVDIPDTSLIKGESFSSIDLNDFINSTLHDTNEIIWTWSHEAGDVLLDITIDSNNEASFDVIGTTDSIGTETIRFLATKLDSSYDFDFSTYSISEADNNRPSFTSFDYDTDVRIETEYLYHASAFDSDGDSLTFELINNSPRFLEVDPLTDSSANIIGVADSSEVGTYTVTILVTDGRGGDTTQVYTLQVTLPPAIEGGDEIYKVYPNPYIESESPSKRIHFENFPTGSNLLLFNLIGDPVLNTTIDNNLFLWNIKIKSGLEVQSGIYFCYVKDNNKIIYSGKIVIIR